jgi:hypothetical protein
MASPVWNTVYTLDVGEVCCESCSVKTSVALGLADPLPLSHPFLVLPQSEQSGAAALAGGRGGGGGVRGVGGVGGEAVVACEAEEGPALGGRSTESTWGGRASAARRAAYTMATAASGVETYGPGS